MALFYWVMIHCHNLFLSLTFTHWHSSRLGHFGFLCHSPTIILSFSVLFFRTVSTVGRCVHVCVCERHREGDLPHGAHAACGVPVSCCLLSGCVSVSEDPWGTEGPRLGTGPSYPPSASHLSFCHLNLWKTARRQPFRKTKEKTPSSPHVS